MKLPSEPPAGVPLDSLTRLEVLVSASGEVESIKIVVGPQDALDSMMVSAVKAWKFQPATKDGRPVPYRHQVWLTNTYSR
jgi:TonB family protein